MKQIGERIRELSVGSAGGTGISQAALAKELDLQRTQDPDGRQRLIDPALMTLIHQICLMISN